VGPLIEQQRMVKPMRNLRKSGSLCRRTRQLSTGQQANCSGLRECDVAAELEYEMRRLGAEKPSFETIVAAGERTALPHARPTGRKIGAMIYY